MIPKIIHYCWLGGKKPKEVEQYIKGWKMLCPDYLFYEWNEDNSSKIIESCNFAKDAYNNKKWAFVSDYLRFFRLYEFGGIYLDTDVEMLKPFDALLYSDLFLGYETVGVGSGIIGASVNNAVIGNIIKRYEETNFLNPDGTFNLLISPDFIDYELDKLGFKRDNIMQKHDNIIVYPSDWFCPYSLRTLRTVITSNTITNHHYAGSWLDEKGKYRVLIQKKLIKYFGESISYKLAVFVTLLKFDGVKQAVSKAIRMVKKQ